MSSKNANIFKTGTAVASFAHVFHKNKYGKYSVNLILTPAVYSEKNPDHGCSLGEWFTDIQRLHYGENPDKTPKYPVDRPFPIAMGINMLNKKTNKTYNGYEGNIIVLSTSNDPIPVYGPDRSLISDPNRMYSGVYVKAILLAHKYVTFGGGISLICKGLQIVGDGTPLGNSIDVDGMFDDESASAAEYAKNFPAQEAPVAAAVAAVETSVETYTAPVNTQVPAVGAATVGPVGASATVARPAVTASVASNASQKVPPATMFPAGGDPSDL